MSSNILCPVTEINQGNNKHKLTLDIGANGLYSLNSYPPLENGEGVSIKFSCDFEICTDTEDFTYGILIEGAERYAKCKGIKDFIPLVVKPNKSSYTNIIIDLDNLRIFSTVRESECGSLKSINIIRSLSHDEDRSCKRDSSIQVQKVFSQSAT